MKFDTRPPYRKRKIEKTGQVPVAFVNRGSRSTLKYAQTHVKACVERFH